jgi:L-lactate dehydrogenase (cytochrome)
MPATSSTDTSADFVSSIPSTAELRARAKRRMPPFVFDYLDGGCNEDVNLRRNVSDLQSVQLMPKYLSEHTQSDMKTTIFGHTYDAPIGVAPVGLQGLMWPNCGDILAAAAHRHNLPFCLSTVSTTSIERAAELTDGKAWFQLYHPTEDSMRDDIMDRCKEVGVPVLVILADVPSFGFRPRDIRNGLAMPPSMSLKNIFQITCKPTWAINTLKHGSPEFATLKKYIPPGLNMAELGKFMDKTFSGRLNEEKIKPIRDNWPGKLVVKGIVNEEDADRALRLGCDGFIVSNHGGRQLDAGQSTIKPLYHLAKKFRDKCTVMVDGGGQGGPDVARAMACGAHMMFMGRTFMYGVGALGERGGNHTMAMLKRQLHQVMEQLCCEDTSEFPNHLIEEGLFSK